mgnify:CR=1 FL=1
MCVCALPMSRCMLLQCASRSLWLIYTSFNKVLTLCLLTCSCGPTTQASKLFMTELEATKLSDACKAACASNVSVQGRCAVRGPASRELLRVFCALERAQPHTLPNQHRQKPTHPLLHRRIYPFVITSQPARGLARPHLQQFGVTR